jgi:hypothetical protein
VIVRNLRVNFSYIFYLQGCQICLDTIYQNEEKYTNLPLNNQLTQKYTKRPGILNGH